MAMGSQGVMNWVGRPDKGGRPGSRNYLQFTAEQGVVPVPALQLPPVQR
jgi:hypothetical protein